LDSSSLKLILRNFLCSSNNIVDDNSYCVHCECSCGNFVSQDYPYKHVNSLINCLRLISFEDKGFIKYMFKNDCDFADDLWKWFFVDNKFHNYNDLLHIFNNKNTEITPFCERTYMRWVVSLCGIISNVIKTLPHENVYVSASVKFLSSPLTKQLRLILGSKKNLILHPDYTTIGDPENYLGIFFFQSDVSNYLSHMPLIVKNFKYSLFLEMSLCTSGFELIMRLITMIGVGMFFHPLGFSQEDFNFQECSVFQFGPTKSHTTAFLCSRNKLYRYDPASLSGCPPKRTNIKDDPWLSIQSMKI